MNKHSEIKLKQTPCVLTTPESRETDSEMWKEKKHSSLSDKTYLNGVMLTENTESPIHSRPLKSHIKAFC